MAKGTLQIAYDKLLLENLELKERITELEAEKSDAAYLQAVRERIYENVLGLIDENESTQLDTDDDVDF